MKTNERYSMTYYGGDGGGHHGGIWEITDRPKTVVFKRLVEPFFDSPCPEMMIISKEKERTHCLRDWEDGDYTVYPHQCGVPCVFRKLEKREELLDEN